MMLASTPQNETKSSYLFSNAANTIAQGNPVPVLYGKMVITPPLISEEIDTEALSTNMSSTLFDGKGNWVGDGNLNPWGASVAYQ